MLHEAKLSAYAHIADSRARVFLRPSPPTGDSSSSTTGTRGAERRLQPLHRKCLTSGLYLPDAHIHHHGPLGGVRFDERGQVTAVHLLHMLQVWLTVVGDHLGALLVNIQPTIYRRKKGKSYDYFQSGHSGVFL